MVTLLTHLTFKQERSTTYADSNNQSGSTPNVSFRQTMHDRIVARGGRLAYFLDAMRLAICFALLGLTLITSSKGMLPYAGLYVCSHRSFASTENREADLTPTQFYTTVLALTVLAAPAKAATLASAHLTVILVAVFGVVADRDLVPLGTFTSEPADGDDWVTWLKAGLLAVAAVLIPVCTPRAFTQFDTSVSRR